MERCTKIASGLEIPQSSSGLSREAAPSTVRRRFKSPAYRKPGKVKTLSDGQTFEADRLSSRRKNVKIHETSGENFAGDAKFTSNRGKRLCFVCKSDEHVSCQSPKSRYATGVGTKDTIFQVTGDRRNCSDAIRGVQEEAKEADCSGDSEVNVEACTTLGIK